MKEPVWIRLDVVLRMHEEVLMLHGGREGVRDLGLLESALARPKNLFAYSEQDVSIVRFAAAYANGIIANHPFVDGNKRTAFTVSLTFLKLNGLEVTATKEDRVLTFWSLAAGEISEKQLALWFERNTAPRYPSPLKPQPVVSGGMK
jgi:death-on-curing protein